MSIQEMIASLVQQKAQAAQRYDAAIEKLKELEANPASQAPVTGRKLRFQPIKIKGEPLSQTVIEGRGPY